MDASVEQIPIAFAISDSAVEPVLPSRSRTLRYTGSVSRVLGERVLNSMGKLLDAAPEEEIALFVNSPGGTTGVAMSFYDSVRQVLKPRLVTIGSGEIDSSGMIIFLSGARRYVSARTTALLHPAGRYFGTQRYTAREMAAMLAEDRLKDTQYASVIAENSRGHLTQQEVLGMMEEHTVLAPKDLLDYGLIDGILA